MHYRSFGKGPPLILLHGGLSSGLDWFSQLPGLSNHFQTIVIDLRGHGRSTIGSKPFSYKLFARDVVQVLDALEIDRWKELWTKVTLMWKKYPQLSEADLHSIKSPVQIVVGANDLVEIAHAKQMTELIPGARLEILADTGHAVLREAPDRVLQLILGFFCPKGNCQ